MKKNFAWILLVHFSCNQEFKVNKDFDLFFEKYFTNLEFKLERTKFPLKETILSSNSINYLSKQDFINLGKYNLLTKSESGYHGLKFEKISNIRVNVIFSFKLKSENPYLAYKFKNENGKWYLFEIEDRSIATNL